MEKENGRKWDGKSRVSNDTYRKRYDEIFKKEKTTSELLEEGFEEEQEYLKELEDKREKEDEEYLKELKKKLWTKK